MKCWICGNYTFDEHNVCVRCGEKDPSIPCTTNRCGWLHVDK